jgi:hypothetical protein
MKRRDLILTAAALAATRAALAAAPGEPVRLRELYNKDLSFSDLAISLAGERISVQGFMAPPLKAESHFFVLTRRPMSVCPFCETEAQWPDDIIAVYTKRAVEIVPFNVAILTYGALDLGAWTDPDTGFVSRVRLLDSSYACI